MVQEVAHFWVANQEFVVTQDETGEEEVHIECACHHKVEVFQLAAIWLDHLFREEALDTTE